MIAFTRILVTASLSAVVVSAAASAQAPSQLPAIEPIPAYTDPGSIPLSEGKPLTPENWDRFFGGRVVRNVTLATLTPVLPDPAKATGAAVIVAPGGGFFMLSIDSEGYDVARWLAERGIAAFLLKYRLEPTPSDSKAFLEEAKRRVAPPQATGSNPVDDSIRTRATSAAVEDARSAIRLIRLRASEWKVDPARVGMIGFSAGAITTLEAGLGAPDEARLDFIAPIYGPVGSRAIPADAPPMFAAISADDMPVLIGDLGLPAAYHKAGRPIEFHLYEGGGHGYGMRQQGKTSDLWIEQFYTWMKARGLLDRR